MAQFNGLFRDDDDHSSQLAAALQQFSSSKSAHLSCVQQLLVNEVFDISCLYSPLKKLEWHVFE
jgi:hypothetical protein